jgi:hypothetical protein
MRASREKDCMKYVLAVLALLVFACVIPGAVAQDACKETSYGKCFSIHARFAVYTGDGVEDLWPVGSKRLLRVNSPSDQLEAMTSDGHLGEYFVFGDFVACPLEKEAPGKMRTVCIKEMKNLRRVKRKEE